MVTGMHQYSTRLGVLCEPAEFNGSGIKSYVVKLQPDNEKVVVDVSCLVPRSVIELYHKRTELMKTNQIQPRPDTCVCQIQYGRT
jgi:hypothetical protein